MQARELTVGAREYLAHERKADARSELREGQVVALAGATRAHGLVAGNAFWRLAAQLEGRPCEAHTADTRVATPDRRSYFYPDVSIACGDIDFGDDGEDTLLNPTVIIEVLSPGTETYDRGGKWGQYQLLPSLQHYLLIAQDEAVVELFTRTADGWLYSRHAGLDATVDLPAVGCRLHLAEVYDRVALPDAPAAEG